MIQVPVEEMENPTPYDVIICMELDNTSSCVSFQVVIDGEVSNKAQVVEEIISDWGSIVEIEDGTILNLKQFKEAFVHKSDDNKPSSPHLRVV